MKKRQVSLIIFYTKDKKILLQNRKFKNNINIEWGYFGGGIEKFESPEEALLREVKEELTYELKNYEYVGEYKNIINELELEVEAFVYITPINDTDIFVQIEGEKMGLFTIEQARKLRMTKELDYHILDMIENKFKLIF